MEAKWNNNLESYEANIFLKLENNSDGDEYKHLRNIIVQEQEKFGFIPSSKVRSATYMTIGKYNAELNSASSEELTKHITESIAKYEELLADIKGIAAIERD